MTKRNRVSGLVSAPVSPEMAQRERRYQAEEALRTLTRAAEIRRDGQLMREVKKIANQQVKAVSSSGRR